ADRGIDDLDDEEEHHGGDEDGALHEGEPDEEPLHPCALGAAQLIDGGRAGGAGVAHAPIVRIRTGPRRASGRPVRPGWTDGGDAVHPPAGGRDDGAGLTRDRLGGLAATTLTPILWGTTGTAAPFAPGLGPLALGAAALGVGGLLQAAIADPALRRAGPGVRR